MPRKFALPVFACVALLQLAAPLSMISRREMTLRNGRQYRFKTAPVDPYDAFRGRYVALGMRRAGVRVEDTTRFARGQRVFVLLGRDDGGFAVLDGIAQRRPRDRDYLSTRIRALSRTEVSVALPFDRYYMNEKLSFRADYREMRGKRGRSGESPDASSASGTTHDGDVAADADA